MKYIKISPALGITIFQFSLLLFVGYLTGVNFNLSESFDTLVQLFPIYEYQNHGFKIIYYLHSQPPLLNTIAIIFYKISGEIYFEYALIILVLFMLYLNIFLINFILLKLNANLNFSWLYIFFPSFGLYHTWYYEPIFSLFFINLFILSVLVTPSLKSFILFVISITGLSLVHGIFQPVITLTFFIFGFFLLFKRVLNVKVLIVSCLILFIPIGFSIKNFYLANSFATSSWGGCNLSQKWPDFTSGFLHVPPFIPDIPSPLGLDKFNNGKINYNNLNFADTCRATLKTIIVEAIRGDKFQPYLLNVYNGFIKSESKLSIEASLNCCSLGGDRWGIFKTLPFSLKPYNLIYGNILLFSIFIPLVIYFKLPSNINKYSYILILFLFYYSLLTSHFLNGEEQERMAFKNSFFLYLCFIYFLYLVIYFTKFLFRKINN